MSPPSEKPPLELIEAADQAAWELWLEQHGTDAPGVWLKLAKKGAPRSTVTQQEAVDSAICFGWIDGQIKGIDAHFYSQRFTPRRPRSRWSLINTQRVARLTAEGRMRPAGDAEVAAARADGRWDAAYSQARDEVPEDFAQAIAANPAAAEHFAGLSSQNRFAFLFRLGDARTPDARAKRISTYVEMLSQGRTFH